MRLKPEQLSASLGRRGLDPVYLLCGEEPLQMMEILDELRSFARAHGIDERVVLTVNPGFDWSTLRREAGSYSLFSAKRLIELRLGASPPGVEGAGALTDYSARPPEDVVLIVSAARLDKKAQETAWFKSLDRAGIVIQVRSVEAGALPQWIMQRFALKGRRISPEAADFLAERVEGNLLAAQQEIERLLLLTDTAEIDLDEVMAAVSDSSRYSVFELVDCALDGQVERTLRILHGLRSEGIEPLLVNWAVTRELRLLCLMAGRMRARVSLDTVLRDFRVWEQRKSVVRKALRRHTERTLQGLLLAAGLIDRVIKGAVPGEPWDALMAVCVVLGRGQPVLRG